MSLVLLSFGLLCVLQAMLNICLRLTMRMPPAEGRRPDIIAFCYDGTLKGRKVSSVHFSSAGAVAVWYMSSFLFWMFPHVSCCDTVRWQMAVGKPNPSLVHRTGWRLPPAVITSRPRGGAGTRAGGTACRRTQTWS